MVTDANFLFNRIILLFYVRKRLKLIYSSPKKKTRFFFGKKSKILIRKKNRINIISMEKLNKLERNPVISTTYFPDAAEIMNPSKEETRRGPP